jgi:sugar phosphate isomerase/epimerase
MSTTTAPSTGPDSPRLAIQLYSLRERAAERGLEAVLGEVAEIGYAGVELAKLHGQSPDRVRATLDQLGLAVAAAHVGLPEPDDRPALLDDCGRLGARDLVVAYLPPEDFASAAAVDAAADRLNDFATAARAHGMTLGYHNHFWEFSSTIAGETAHARLFRRLDPGIFAEVDTYWAKVGGVDPVAVLAALGVRARLLHIKDGPADDARAPMTAVGSGRMDVPALLGASRAEWHVVELDRCATDMLEAVRASHRYLAGLG